MRAVVPDPVVPAAAALPERSNETFFGAHRAEAVRRSFEPGFVLFETATMDTLRSRAAARGIAYDALVRLIIRDHLADY